jgi:hypothetical protein
MQCPKCSYARTANDSLVPEWQCPKCGIVYSKYKKSAEKTVSVSLTSGHVIEFKEIKLYDSRQLKQLSDLQSSIEKNFRGYRTGIGFVGDVEDVVAGSLVTGVIEGVVSGSMAATGVKQVEEAKELYRRIRNTGYAVNVSAIENIDLPQPELWRVPHFKTTAKVDLLQIPSKFITVIMEGKDVAVFWDKIESYSASQPS